MPVTALEDLARTRDAHIAALNAGDADSLSARGRRRADASKLDAGAAAEACRRSAGLPLLISDACDSASAAPLP